MGSQVRLGAEIVDLGASLARSESRLVGESPALVEILLED